MQAFLVVVLAAVLALAVTDVVDNWSDWLVLGVIIMTLFALSAAVFNRRYPTKKRSFSRDSDSRW
jgi:uncharacterized membrane protein